MPWLAVYEETHSTWATAIHSGLGGSERSEGSRCESWCERLLPGLSEELWLLSQHTAATDPSQYLKAYIPVLVRQTGVSHHWSYTSKESRLCRICDNSLHSGSLKRRELKWSPNSLVTGRRTMTMRIWCGKRVWNWVHTLIIHYH